MQSIRLHIERVGSQAKSDTSMATERRRHVWSCKKCSRSTCVCTTGPTDLQPSARTIAICHGCHDETTTTSTGMLNNLQQPSPAHRLANTHIALISFSDVISQVLWGLADNALDSLEAASTNDDAETCLRPFEALSANNIGARPARNMIQSLKEYDQEKKTE